MMKQVIALLLLLSLGFAEDLGTDDMLVGEEEFVEDTVVGSSLCTNCRSDNKCGANKAHPIKRAVGNGACSSGDYKRYSNVASKEQCAEKCRAAKSSVKFIEYNASSKKCDCDRGSSCRLCCTRSSGKGFISYELNGAVAGACPAGKCCKNNSCGCCPKNCSWKAFGAYGACSKSCGGGKKTRTRGQNAASCGGKACSGSASESANCNTHACIALTKVGSGACSSGDFARYSGVASKEECASKCKAKKSSVKFIEYNAGSKKCDCDNGSSCRLCCTNSSGRGFISYKFPEPCGLKSVGAGACSSGDFARYSNVASKEACAKKCKAKKSSVKYIEYNAGSKKCDCDKGSSCRLCCTRSSGKGFTSYQITSGCTAVEEDEEQLDEAFESDVELEEVEDETVGTTTLVVAGAGVVAAALFGVYKFRTRSGEYQYLTEV